MKPSSTPPCKSGGQLQAWRKEWRTVLSEQQNHRCCWCGVRTCDEPQTANSVTLEHVTPLSKGGKDHPDNFAVSCASCNHRRGSMHMNAFIRVIWDLKRASAARREREQMLREMGISPSRRKPGRNMRMVEQVQAREAIEKNLPCPFPEGSRGYKIYKRYCVRLPMRSSLDLLPSNQ